MTSVLYDDPLHENRASDETQAAYAEAIRAGAAGRREREAGAETVPGR